MFIELVALPLIHTGWLTALVDSAGHAWVLSRRVAVEEAVLLRNGNYRATVAHRPRFVPRLFDKRATLAVQVDVKVVKLEREAAPAARARPVPRRAVKQSGRHY